jgi:hypothetical protein
MTDRPDYLLPIKEACATNAMRKIENFKRHAAIILLTDTKGILYDLIQAEKMNFVRRSCI